MMTDPLDTYEVAVTVFARVPGRDAGDAANRLEAALRYQMRWNADGLCLPEAPRGATGYDIPVHDVMETGVALANGFLWARVTTKAARQSTHPPVSE
jgi:hypothetical protein